MGMQRPRRWGLIACLSALLTLAHTAGPAQADEGKYANLTALWWQWVSARPAVDVNGTNTHPILDTSGEYAAVGQEQGIGPGGKFFFLAGTFGGDVTRTVTVPAGKALFFPILNVETDNAVDPPTNYKVPTLKALAKASIDSVISSSIYARLNGIAVETFRKQSPVFAYTLPDENSIYDYFGLVGPQFEGTVKPAVGDGYWAYIAPLPPGVYTIEFGAATSSGFSLNVTYVLTIE